MEAQGPTQQTVACLLLSQPASPAKCSELRPFRGLPTRPYRQRDFKKSDAFNAVRAAGPNLNNVHIGLVSKSVGTRSGPNADPLRFVFLRTFQNSTRRVAVGGCFEREAFQHRLIAEHSPFRRVGKDRDLFLT